MRLLGWTGSAALLGLCIALCFVGNSYQLYLIALVGLTTMVGAGLNVLFGLSGQVSLGHVGFYAIGAYTSAILTATVGSSFWLALLLAGLLAGLVGTVLALPALRVTGPYLAMVTIAFGFIVEHGTVEWRALTGGANGLLNIPPPTAFSYPFSERDVALLLVGLTALVLWLFWRLSMSPWGLALRAGPRRRRGCAIPRSQSACAAHGGLYPLRHGGGIGGRVVRPADGFCQSKRFSLWAIAAVSPGGHCGRCRYGLRPPDWCGTCRPPTRMPVGPCSIPAPVLWCPALAGAVDRP